MNQQRIAIVGAAGKLGYATSQKLREAGVPVTAILRDASKATRLSGIGCEIAIADVQDSTALARAMANADAVQIIVPAPQSEDALGEMRRVIENIAGALEQARPKQVLAISDYGAHVEEYIGMPTMFRLFEERLRRLEMPKVFLRSAAHMENWARVIPVAAAAGMLPSFQVPVERPFPTVSALDAGVIAAEFLLDGETNAAERVVHVEGPRRYSARDAAAALSELLGRTVTAQEVPRLQWQESLERGASPKAASLLADFFDAQNKGGLVEIESNSSEVRRGTTDLIAALRPFVQSAG